MKRKKLIVRAVSLFMVGLITILALIIPTSAIMAEYPTEDNNTYIGCVMPFNVNFIGTDGTFDYVYSVPVGYNSPVVQTGVNGHETLSGRALGDGGVTANTASLEYVYYPTEWRIGYDGTEYDNGFGGVPVELRIDNTELDGKTIVIEAPTFYVNPLASNWYNVSNTDTYNRWSMGAFRMPTLSGSDTQAYVGRYTVFANVVDDVGAKHPVAYSKTFDTRVDNDWISMLEPSIFQDYVINSIQQGGYNRIVAVTDFKAYVDYDVYEYVVPTVPDISFTVDAETFTTPQGTTWASFVEGYNNDTFRNFEGEIQFEVGTDVWAPISTDGTQANIVEPTDLIQATAYLTYLGEEEAGDELQGTWELTAPAFALPYEFFETCGNRINVSFVSNGRSFNYIEYQASASDGDELYYDMRQVISGGGTSYGAWTSEGYKILEISSNLSEVTNGSAFLTFLQNHGTKRVSGSSGGSGNSLDDGPVVASTDTPVTTAEGGEWQLVENSPLKATGIDVSYPVYDHYTFDNDTDLALNYGYPDFNRYITKFRGIGNIDNNVDFTGWIANATSGFLNFELMPNFSIGGVLAILVGFSLVILFLKIFAGG